MRSSNASSSNSIGRRSKYSSNTDVSGTTPATELVDIQVELQFPLQSAHLLSEALPLRPLFFAHVRIGDEILRPSGRWILLHFRLRSHTQNFNTRPRA